MYIIYPRRDTAVTTSTGSAAYPSSYVLDYHKKRYWQTNGTTAHLKLTVSKNAKALYIANTNAKKITVTISSSNGAAYQGPTNYGTTSLTRYYTDTGASWKDIYIPYTSRGEKHWIDINFTSTAGENPKAGVIYAGWEKQFDGPLYGMKKLTFDMSIVHQLNEPGAVYILQKDAGRIYTGSMLLEGDTEYWHFQRDLVEQIGPYPAPWKISDTTDRNWLLFASLEIRGVQASYEFPGSVIVDFSLRERF